MKEIRVPNFGQDLIPLEATDSGLTFKLRKAPENYTNVELMSPELEGSTGYLSRVAVAELSRMTHLRTLSIGHLNKPYNDSIHEVFALMTQLRVLKLNKVFSTSFESFMKHGLILLTSLEALEIHSHPSQEYSVNFWKGLGDASAHIKLKRFAYTECVAPSSIPLNLENVMSALSKFKTLESCKIFLNEFMSSDQLHRDLFLAHLIDNQQLSVLEIGTFNFSHQADRDFVEAVLKASGGLRSFGLKLSHWDAESAKYLSEMLNRNPGNISQLILNVAADKDFNFVGFATDLMQTHILDIRFVQNDVDLTPDSLKQFYREKVSVLLAKKEPPEPQCDLEALLTKIIQDMSSVAILDYQLMYTMIIYLRLNQFNEKEPVKDLDRFFDKLFAWIEIGKVSRSFMLTFIQTIPEEVFDQFLRILQACLRECSQEEIESVIKPTFSSKIYGRLNVINQKFEPHFFAKLEKTSEVVDHKALEMISSELDAFVEIVDDPRYRDLMYSVDRDRCKITVSIFKDKILYCLGREEYLLKECIRSQMPRYLESSDEDFNSWMVSVVTSFNAEGHYNNDRSPSILRMLLAEISSPQRLILIVKAIGLLFVVYSSFPKERYILLVQSLAIMRMAMRRAYEDNDGLFQNLFNQFVEMKSTVSYGLSKEEIRSSALKEVDEMMDALFRVEAPEVKPVVVETEVDSVKTSFVNSNIVDLAASKDDEAAEVGDPNNVDMPSSKEDEMMEVDSVKTSLVDPNEVAELSLVETSLVDMNKADMSKEKDEEEAQGQKPVSLKDMLKARKEGESTSGKRVPLKDLLKAKKEGSPQSGKFFEGQDRSEAGEGNDPGEGNRPN